MNFLSRLRRKIPTPGIRAKVIGIVLGATMLLTLSTLLYVNTILRITLDDQLDQKTISLTRDVAARSMEPILTNNIFKLHQLAYNTMDNNDDVIYVFFIDDTGNILAHTFKDYFPPDLLTIEHEGSGAGNSLRKFQTEEGVLRDAAAPVFPGPDPEETVRVGLVDYSLQEALAASTQRLLLISAITFVIMSIIVYFITTLTTIKPLNSLMNLVQAVAQGDLSQRATVKSGDELSILANNFNAMTQQLAQAQEARERLMQRIIHSQEDERRRISRELHDETGQMLSTLMISLHFLETCTNLNELKQKTAEFRQLLLKSLEQVRLLAWKLTPAPLIDLGLKAAIESNINKYRDYWEINLRMEGLEHHRFPPETEVSIYRVTQEALTNIARHARAKNVDILLDCQGDKLLVTIEDDGVGFDLEKLEEESELKTNLGLVSMQERISLAGGKLKIESSPGKGTTLHVSIPLLPPEVGADPG